jgi:gluconate 5-dehydrogenase
MKKMAMPDDCIGTAVYLASSASDFVTGNIVYPDGGLTAVG